ncbi:flagellar motor switch protein FliN [Sulfuriflexus mobilis]|uniref:flagellar motor switch protein FliN n=1 Tax=Sulfuriflexus mobilis TaxID=1811807 RepID=UPI000F82B5E8|nr:flagellar motor switch protein FliN [Sulfuriflexus mobilis]
MNDTTDENEQSADVADDWAAAMEESGDAAAVTDSDAQAAPMPQLEDDAEAVTNEDANIDVILDIPVTIAMEIGRTTINIRNLLQLNQGSVVELDRLAGEPMDVMVNGTLIAHGEVVVVNDKFGIRLTDVVSAAERLKKLK